MLTILGVSFRDLPIVRKITVKIRLPYWVWNLVFFKRTGISLVTGENQAVDRLLYDLFGYYRELGISSSRVDELGNNKQFAHDPNISAAEFSEKILAIISSKFEEKDYPDIYKIIKLWSYYTGDSFDSRIIEVIQVSILVNLDCSIRIAEKQTLVDFICDFFILKYRRDRNTHQKYFEDMEDALLYLIPSEKQVDYVEDYAFLQSKINRKESLSSLLSSIDYINQLIDTAKVNI